MKKQINIQWGKRGIMLLVIACLLTGSSLLGQNQASVIKGNTKLEERYTNAPPPGFATRMDYLKSFTKEEDIREAYSSRKIEQEEAYVAAMAIRNKNSMDIYGKVVDQDGQPVVGAKVQGLLGLGLGDPEKHGAETDAEGLFHFAGLRGQQLSVEIEKEGYLFDYMLPSAHRPHNHMPDPKKPLVFTMWKQHGAEPMRRSNLHAYIPCDGSFTRFNLLTGKKDADGDLSVSMTRNPLNIERGKPFDWSVTIEIANGGLQEITNIYPNEAPADGYQPAITLNFPTNKVEWKSDFKQAYYFKGKSGEIYGRMTIKTMADFQPPPTLFDAEIYANPAGSRNLEFDPQKRIRN